MSTSPDGFDPSPNAASLRTRAGRYVVAIAMVLMVAFGVSQASFAAQTDTSPTPSAADTSNASNTVNGNETFSVADVAEAANPAVVTIYTYTNQLQSQQGAIPGSGNQNGQDPSGTEQPVGAGSGWIYDADGHVVTNNHVVQGADSFVVQYADGTKVNAKLVGTDQFQDVAVLQLDLSNGAKVPGVATIGDSSTMRAGDQVVAIGSPLGEFTNSVSEGIIGGLDRSLDTGAGYSLDNLIQHDAPLSPGNSGGPLLNMQGQVVGMNVAKVDYQQTGEPSASGLGFAIDGNTVKGIVDQIISNDGDIVFPYLGVSTQELQDGTVQVGQVEQGSPADDAGLVAGDIITQVDGTDVTTDAPLLNLLFAHKPGDEVQLTVLRNGETQTLTVTLGERPSSVQ